jgi:hypothetical protein
MIAHRRIFQLDPVALAVELAAAGAAPKSRRDAWDRTAVAKGAIAATRNVSPPINTAAVGKFCFRHRNQVHADRPKNLALPWLRGVLCPFPGVRTMIMHPTINALRAYASVVLALTLGAVAPAAADVPAPLAAALDAMATATGTPTARA